MTSQVPQLGFQGKEVNGRSAHINLTAGEHIAGRQLSGLANALSRHICSRVMVHVDHRDESSEGHSVLGMAELLISEGSSFRVRLESRDGTVIGDLHDRVTGVMSSLGLVELPA